MMKLNHIGLLAEDCEEAVKHINTMLGELKWEYFDYFFRRRPYPLENSSILKQPLPISGRWILKFSSRMTARGHISRRH